VRTEVLDNVGVRVLVLVVVEETDGLVELLGVLVSVDDDVIETEEEGVFVVVVEAVSVEELESTELCVIEGLLLSD
jgi:hypothetical protein